MNDDPCESLIRTNRTDTAMEIYGINLHHPNKMASDVENHVSLQRPCGSRVRFGVLNSQQDGPWESVGRTCSTQSIKRAQICSSFADNGKWLEARELNKQHNNHSKYHTC